MGTPDLNAAELPTASRRIAPLTRYGGEPQAHLCGEPRFAHALMYLEAQPRLNLRFSAVVSVLLTARYRIVSKLAGTLLPSSFTFRGLKNGPLDEQI